MSFRMNYWNLPPKRDIDFVIELHCGTSPISMTPHRMTPVEL